MNNNNENNRSNESTMTTDQNFLIEPSLEEIFQKLINCLSLITHESDLDRQLMLLADLGREVTRSDRCTVWISEPEDKTLWTKVAHGIDRIVLPDNMGIVGSCYSTGENIVINDAYSDPRFDSHTDRKTGYITRNILALPLHSSTGQVIGVFQAINKLSSDRVYSKNDVQRAFLVASYVGRMLEACILYNQIRESRELLKKNQERLKNILEATNDGFWDWSVEKQELFISPAWAKYVTGRDVVAHFNDLARKAIHEDDKKAVEDVFLHQLSSRNNSYEVEYRLRTFDDRILWVEERGRVIEWNDEGKANRLVGTFKDVTSRKMALHEKAKLEAQLQHVQRLESLGVMAGGIAHDYNNMLSTIIGNTEIAILDSPDGSPVIPYLEQIQSAAHRSSELTRQLLNYAGGGKFVVAPVSINSTIKETLELVKASLSKKAELKLDLMAELPEIIGDSAQIRQVIMNLVINASDALKNESGTVSIATNVQKIDPDCFWLYQPEQLKDYADKSYVTLTVTDTGCGIEERLLGKIFEPFFSTKDSGRGLGLAAVIGIVKSHKGGLSVKSEFGKGTEFIVQLPVRELESDSQAVADKLRSSLESSGTGNIIVADDEETLLLVLNRILNKAGYKVLSAKNGLEAWELYQKHGIEIDLLILDTNMPELSGPEVLKKVKDADSAVPVILMSGYAQLSDEESMVQPDAFIQKPFTRQTILEVIQAKLKPLQTQAKGKN